MTFDNTNTIIVFKNDKGDNAKRPDYTGTINIEGKEYSLSMWIKEGKKGKFMAGPVEPKEKVFKDAKKAASQTQQVYAPQEDSDVPF